jgi:hypothetical protein
MYLVDRILTFFIEFIDDGKADKLEFCVECMVSYVAFVSRYGIELVSVDVAFAPFAFQIKHWLIELWLMLLGHEELFGK